MPACHAQTHTHTSRPSNHDEAAEWTGGRPRWTSCSPVLFVYLHGESQWETNTHTHTHHGGIVFVGREPQSEAAATAAAG